MRNIGKRADIEAAMLNGATMSCVHEDCRFRYSLGCCTVREDTANYLISKYKMDVQNYHYYPFSDVELYDFKINRLLEDGDDMDCLT